MAAADLVQSGQKGPGTGWELPPEADTKKSPVEADAKILATGKSVFKDK